MSEEVTKTTQSIYAAINAIQCDIPAIGKDSRNQQQGFNFRGIDAVYNVLKPLLAKHKVFTMPEVVELRREERQTKSGGTLAFVSMTMRYHFVSSVDGSEVIAVVVGEGMDSGDKATNKAMSIAHKYALFQVFCIPTEDVVDPDATTPEPLAPAPVMASRESLDIMVDAFDALDVTQAMLKVRLGHDIYKTTIEEKAELGREYNKLQKGSMQLADWAKLRPNSNGQISLAGLKVEDAGNKEDAAKESK